MRLIREREKLMRLSILLLILAFATGCTSTSPTVVRSQAPTSDTEFAEAREDAKQAPPPPKPAEKEKNGEEKKEESKKDKEKEGPKHIRDNGFFIEEAFNQEPGDVQHIFNWINFWDHTSQTRTRNFAWTYSMELPLGTQDHQFSFMTTFLTGYEKPVNRDATVRGDVGDTFLNYRYQLLADDEFLWCAPRFTVILPTGDKRNGTGTGEVGYQFNLPISHYGEDFDYHFNAGVTYEPGVSSILDNGIESPRWDLRLYNVGVAAYWKPKTNLHFFVELALYNENIKDDGGRGHQTQVLANPGFRYAIFQQDEIEWVVGCSVPIGLTRESPNVGVFVYMSVEHAFRKKDDKE